MLLMIGLAKPPRPARTYLFAAALVVGAALIFGWIASTAGAKLCEYCIHDVGLETFYTHHPDCGGQPTDPINVVWFDYLDPNSFASKVQQDLQTDSTPYPYPPPALGPAWFGVPSTDPQGVRDIVGGTCTTEALDSGTDGSISSNRGHVRLFNVQTGPFWFVVGDAHEDLDPSGTGLDCHGSSSFDGPKRDIYSYFPQPKHWEFWGNTRSIYQPCLGRSTSSNGYVAVMGA
jgi:hypothetical protein